MDESGVKLIDASAAAITEPVCHNHNQSESGSPQESTSSSSSSSSSSISSHISDEEYHTKQHNLNNTKRSVGVLTETQDLGECAEPGSSILLEGVVWNETNKGVLILNVKWRGKTYVGSLIDTAKSSWASPRFKDFPKGQLKSSSSSANLLNGNNGFGSKKKTRKTKHGNIS